MSDVPGTTSSVAVIHGGIDAAVAVTPVAVTLTLAPPRMGAIWTHIWKDLPNTWDNLETNHQLGHHQGTTSSRHHRVPRVQDKKCLVRKMDCSQAMCSSNKHNRQFCHSNSWCNLNRH